MPQKGTMNTTNQRQRGIRVRSILLLAVPFILSGCAGATGNMSASDPTERGLSYVATAIVTGAVLRAFFNK